MKQIFSHRYVQAIKIYAAAHKIISAIAVIAVLGIVYLGYKSFTAANGENRYVMAAVKRGNIVVSVTGSGQVSASNQVDLKPKISGDIIYIGVKSGQEVMAGTLIAQLDARDAQKSVRDAQANLESAKLQLEKLLGPESAVIPRNKEQAQENLKKSYEDGFNTVANAFLDLPAVITGLHDILIGENFSKGQWNIDYFSNITSKYDEKAVQFRDDAYAKYQEARKAYDKTFILYKSDTRFSDNSTIENLINGTYDTTKIIAESVKSANNLTQFYKDKLTERNLQTEPLADTFLSNLNNYTGKTNAHLLNLLNIKNSISNYKDAALNADLDIRLQKLTVKQKENALLDAKEKLADYFIRAQFDGTIAKLNFKKLDSVANGTVIATLITKQKLAEISLNEVDVAKVKVGQKAILTFDAIEGFSINGEVAELDTVGTVNQGVVTYSLKISFDVQDDRIKPGMSVSAAITMETKQNALAVPNSAIKIQGNRHYVEVFDGAMSSVQPRNQFIEIGLANDAVTEIISGLKEGDQIVVRTIASSASKTPAQSAPSIFGSSGGNRSGGGAVRIPR